MVRKSVVGVAFALMACGGWQGRPATRPVSDVWAKRGAEASAMIERGFRREGRGGTYYAQEYSPDRRAGATFAWGAGVQLSALNAAAEVDRKYLQAAVAYAKSLDAYWIEANGIGGYSAGIHPRGPDRYYDDNAWIVIDLADVYAMTKDPQVLRRATKAMAFVMSGEDDQLGGGIFWHEQERKSKNTCSNAPVVVAAMRLYEVTGEKKYLDIGVRIHKWTREHLQNGDGLYGDNVGLDGKENRGVLTYNSALPIRGACMLYDATKEQAYLEEAQRVAGAAVAKWCRDDGRMDNPGKFAHLLNDALLELHARDHDARWREAAEKAAEWAYRNGRDKAGWYGESWGKPPDAGKPRKIELIDQASAARAYWKLAGAK